MANNAVQVISLKQVPAVSTTGKFVSVTRVSIMVGEHGPFTKDFPKGDDSPEVINAWKQQQVTFVNAVGGS